MQRNETECDPTYVRSNVDLSVEDTVLDPRAMQGLPPELRALIDECVEPSSEPSDQTRMGYLVPSEDDEIFTVNGYREIALSDVLPPPPIPSSIPSAAPRPAYLTSGFQGPPNADTAVLPRDMSEQSLVESMSVSLEHLELYARLSTYPELPPPEPLHLPPLAMIVMEETRAFASVNPSDPIVKAVSDSFPSYQAVRAVTPRRSNPAEKVISSPLHKAASNPAYQAAPATPSRPKIEVPPQRYIHTVISEPHPGQLTAKRSGLFARFMSWLLPSRPGFVDSPRKNYYAAKTSARVPAAAR